MKVNLFIVLTLVLLPIKAIADDKALPVFNNLVQFSASVDAYSEMCVKAFNPENAEADLFDLIESFREIISIDDQEVYKLRDKYFRIKISTTSQLTQLGLQRKKSLCKKYLNIFERFDIKKQQKIDEIILIIDGKK
tara:strand:+ start:166 stop:573 length:408 start_codon:yes stop_codon:yes gene_type:complete